MKENNGKGILSDLILSFFVSTTLITIGSGIIGPILFKEITFGYEAYLSPPIFGLLSSLFGMLNYSKKEMSIAQAILRKGIHLLLIEGLFFALNYIAGNMFEPGMSIILAAFIMVIYILVLVVIWLNDKRMASIFNKELELYQKNSCSG